jgi:glycosyltransferase involved in cell wall biosynthesis
MREGINSFILKYVAEHYTWEKIAGRLKTIYTDVIALQ